VKDETATMPAPELKAPHKELQLKAINSKPFGSGSLSTVRASPKSLGPSPFPISKPKAATLLCRPASQASKRPVVPGEASRNVTQIATLVPLVQKQVSPRRELGAENWTPITAAKVATNTPPPRLRIHRHKRATILPKADATSLFGPVQSPPDPKYNDVFYDRSSNLLPTVSNAPSKALSPHTPPAKLPVKNPSPKPVPEHRGTRSALSLPTRRLQKRARAESKTVTWDPSIVSIGPEVHSISENLPDEDRKEVQIDDAPKLAPGHKLDVKDYMETIKELGKADRSKLVSLIEALKQLELDIEDKEKVGWNAKPSNEHDEGVQITTVRSLDPRVPEFLSSRTVKAKNRTDRVEEPGAHRHAESDLSPFPESDCNKENIPEVPPQQPTKSGENGVSERKKRIITILDDYNSPGREVDSFDHWYGEMQLREFAKRYPLTGRRASAVRQFANISAKIASASENGRSVSGGSEVVARDIRSKIRVDESVSEGTGVERRGRRGNRDEVAKHGKRDNITGRKHTPPKRSDIITPVGPDAAAIQQKLEVLLLKERERKALEGIPEMAKISHRYVDCGTVVGNRNQLYGGLRCDADRSLGAALWIPSERLRL
jgi:hypothetical protein